MGVIRIELDGYSAPLSAGHFAALIQSGKMDGIRLTQAGTSITAAAKARGERGGVWVGGIVRARRRSIFFPARPASLFLLCLSGPSRLFGAGGHPSPLSQNPLPTSRFLPPFPLFPLFHAQPNALTALPLEVLAKGEFEPRYRTPLEVSVTAADNSLLFSSLRFVSHAMPLPSPGAQSSRLSVPCLSLSLISSTHSLSLFRRSPPGRCPCSHCPSTARSRSRTGPTGAAPAPLPAAPLPSAPKKRSRAAGPSAHIRSVDPTRPLLLLVWLPSPDPASPRPARRSPVTSSATDWFVYEFDPKRSGGLGGLSFEEGEFAVVGYVTGGRELLSQIRSGDVVARARLVAGGDRLVIPIASAPVLMGTDNLFLMGIDGR